MYMYPVYFSHVRVVIVQNSLEDLFDRVKLIESLNNRETGCCAITLGAIHGSILTFFIFSEKSRANYNSILSNHD